MGLDTFRNTEAELGVVLKEGVGPCGAAAAGLVGGVRSGGGGGTVDRGATGGIRDNHVFTKELGEEFDVGGFAATGAGT